MKKIILPIILFYMQLSAQENTIDQHAHLAVTQAADMVAKRRVGTHINILQYLKNRPLTKEEIPKTIQVLQQIIQKLEQEAADFPAYKHYFKKLIRITTDMLASITGSGQLNKSKTLVASKKLSDAAVRRQINTYIKILQYLQNRSLTKEELPKAAQALQQLIARLEQESAQFSSYQPHFKKLNHVAKEMHAKIKITQHINDGKPLTTTQLTAAQQLIKQ